MGAVNKLSEDVTQLKSDNVIVNFSPQKLTRFRYRVYRNLDHSLRDHRPPEPGRRQTAKLLNLLKRLLSWSPQGVMQKRLILQLRILLLQPRTLLMKDLFWWLARKAVSLIRMVLQLILAIRGVGLRRIPVVWAQFLQRIPKLPWLGWGVCPSCLFLLGRHDLRYFMSLDFPLSSKNP